MLVIVKDRKNSRLSHDTHRHRLSHDLQATEPPFVIGSFGMVAKVLVATLIVILNFIYSEQG